MVRISFTSNFPLCASYYCIYWSKLSVPEVSSKLPFGLVKVLRKSIKVLSEDKAHFTNIVQHCVCFGGVCPCWDVLRAWLKVQSPATAWEQPGAWLIIQTVPALHDYSKPRFFTSAATTYFLSWWKQFQRPIWWKIIFCCWLEEKKSRLLKLIKWLHNKKF